MSKSAGFTLIELLVTMAVASILVMVAVPSYQSFSRNAKLSDMTGQLVSAMQRARQEAVTSGKQVILMGGAGTATTDASATSNWQQGYRLVKDKTTRELIGQSAMVADGITVTPSTAGLSRIVFLPTGLVNIAGNTTFEVCDGNRGDEQGRRITLMLLGQVRNPLPNAPTYNNPCA